MMGLGFDGFERRSVDQDWILDVHEHHLPELFLSPQVNLLSLFEQSYAGWTLRRPYPLPSEGWGETAPKPEGTPCRWEDLKPYLEERGSNHFVRNLIRGILLVHGQEGDHTLNASNWERLNQAVIQSRQDPGFQARTLTQSGIGKIITDAYTQPTADVRPVLGKGYASVMRINAFCMGYHAEVADHNGNRAWELLGQLGGVPQTLEAYLEAIGHLVSSMASRGQVAFKHALAYDRSLSTGSASFKQASEVWGKANASPSEKALFEDFMVHFFCDLAAERDLPIQVHLGTAWIRGSHPMRLASLVEAHPGTRFLMMHLAYPWSRDLLGMAFVYRNLWIDLTWSWLLSPTHFQMALHEAIEILPDEHRMMMGGDNWHLEETVASMQCFRDLLSEVLDEKVRRAYFDRSTANRLRRRILHENAQAFFKL